MTLRSLFAVLGAISFVTALSFLALFRPPTRKSRHGLPTAGAGVWWIAWSLRLLWIAALFNGWRLLVFNVINYDEPLQHSSWVDYTNNVVSTIVQSVATIVAFFVYLTYRRWDPIDE